MAIDINTCNLHTSVKQHKGLKCMECAEMLEHIGMWHCQGTIIPCHSTSFHSVPHCSGMGQVFQVFHSVPLLQSTVEHLSGLQMTTWLTLYKSVPLAL